jgi:hypothetical protein
MNCFSFIINFNKKLEKMSRTEKLELFQFIKQNELLSPNDFYNDLEKWLKNHTHVNQCGKIADTSGPDVSILGDIKWKKT